MKFLIWYRTRKEDFNILYEKVSDKLAKESSQYRYLLSKQKGLAGTENKEKKRAMSAIGGRPSIKIRSSLLQQNNIANTTNLTEEDINERKSTKEESNEH